MSDNNYSRVLLLCGISGSGKTTFALKMKQEGYEHLSLDRMMWERYGQCGTDYPVDKYPEYRDETERLLRARLIDIVSGGGKATVDFTLCKRAKRDDLRRFVTDAGVEPTLIYFEAPLEELKRRLHVRNLNPGPDSAIVTDEMVEMYYRGFQRPDDDEHAVTVKAPSH